MLPAVLRIVQGNFFNAFKNILQVSLAVSPAPPATDTQEGRSSWRRMAGVKFAWESHLCTCFNGQQNKNSGLAECSILFRCIFSLKGK